MKYRLYKCRLIHYVTGDSKVIDALASNIQEAKDHFLRVAVDFYKDHSIENVWFDGWYQGD